MTKISTAQILYVMIKCALHQVLRAYLIIYLAYTAKNAERVAQQD